jgi:Tfp pilus assembly protein PilZ
VFVRTSEPLAPGRRILIELALPNGRPVEAIGRVAWSKRLVEPQDDADEAGIGVEFLGGAPDQFAELDAFLRADDSAGELSPES